MRVTLRGNDGREIVYDNALGGFGHKASPCFQCGMCCSNWQAPVDRHEIRTISERLNIPLARFYSEYLRQCPVLPNSYLLAHKDGACEFLRREGLRSLCAIHEVKPLVCRNWTPSLDRKECREGLRKLGQPGKAISVAQLNLSPEELDHFCQSLQDTNRNSIMRE